MKSYYRKNNNLRESSENLELCNYETYQIMEMSGKHVADQYLEKPIEVILKNECQDCETYQTAYSKLQSHMPHLMQSRLSFDSLLELKCKECKIRQLSNQFGPMLSDQHSFSSRPEDKLHKNSLDESETEQDFTFDDDHVTVQGDSEDSLTFEKQGPREWSHASTTISDTSILEVEQATFSELNCLKFDHSDFQSNQVQKLSKITDTSLTLREIQEASARTNFHTPKQTKDLFEQSDEVQDFPFDGTNYLQINSIQNEIQTSINLEEHQNVCFRTILDKEQERMNQQINEINKTYHLNDKSCQNVTNQIFQTNDKENIENQQQFYEDLLCTLSECKINQLKIDESKKYQKLGLFKEKSEIRTKSCGTFTVYTKYSQYPCNQPQKRNLDIQIKTASAIQIILSQTSKKILELEDFGVFKSITQSNLETQYQRKMFKIAKNILKQQTQQQEEAMKYFVIPKKYILGNAHRKFIRSFIEQQYLFRQSKISIENIAKNFKTLSRIEKTQNQGCREKEMYHIIELLTYLLLNNYGFNLTDEDLFWVINLCVNYGSIKGSCEDLQQMLQRVCNHLGKVHNKLQWKSHNNVREEEPYIDISITQQIWSKTFAEVEI
eukprot:403350361